jgi:hypothetical protein
MASEKATLTLDRAKVAEAKRLIGGRSMSQVVDVALDRLIRAERLKADVAAYGADPRPVDDLGLGELAVAFDLDDDDVDYDAVYGTGS